MSYLKFYISTSKNNFIVADICHKAETLLQNIQLQGLEKYLPPAPGPLVITTAVLKNGLKHSTVVVSVGLHYSPSPADIVP